MPSPPFVKGRQSISNETGGKIRNMRNSRHIQRILPSVRWLTHETHKAGHRVDKIKVLSTVARPRKDRLRCLWMSQARAILLIIWSWKN